MGNGEGSDCGHELCKQSRNGVFQDDEEKGMVAPFRYDVQSLSFDASRSLNLWAPICI